MIVLDTTLVGYQVFNGTWQLQLALFATTMFDQYMNPDVIITDLTSTQVKKCRNLMLTDHALLFAVLLYQAIDKSDRMPGLKLALTFSMMMFAVYVILRVSELNYFAPDVMMAPN